LTFERNLPMSAPVLMMRDTPALDARCGCVLLLERIIDEFY
jgi:hypothetical protein